MGRIFEIETDELQTVHIIGERLTYIGDEDRVVTPNELLDDYWTEEHLLAIPGGSEALDRWRTGDDVAYQRWNDRERAMIEAEDDFVMSLPLAKRWDLAVKEMGRENVERIWGPRPAD